MGSLAAEVTVHGCNCLKSYNYTLPGTSAHLEVSNGTCIQTEASTLPWCAVDPSTCVLPPHSRDGVPVDNCVVTVEGTSKCAPKPAAS